MQENNQGIAMQTNQMPETLTVREVQQILRIGRNAVYNLMHSNSFPVIKIGNAIRIPREPFCAWLSASHVVYY